MAVPEVSRIEELTVIDPALMHVFLAGPGQGEGVVVHAPPTSWIAVDGCRTERKAEGTTVPVDAILRRWASTGDLELLVLTHPHRDHAYGIPEVIDRHRPKRVALPGCPRPQHNLATIAGQFASSGPSATQLDRLVLQAIRAIEHHSTRPGVELVLLYDGASLNVGEISVHARSPDSAFLAKFWEGGTGLPDRANELSAVLELEYGTTRVVLGADLLVRSADRAGVLPAGWDLVMKRHEHLARHVGFKIPHHGSRNALHDSIVVEGDGPRAWLLSPFNSSSLPRTDDGDGLDLLLRCEEPLHLTALSTSRKLQAAFARRAVTREGMSAAISALNRGDLFQDGDTIVRASTALGALDPVWCVAFDRQGGLVHRWAGAAALEVFRSAQSTASRASNGTSTKARSTRRRVADRHSRSR